MFVHEVVKWVPSSRIGPGMIRHWAGLILALYVLNFALSFHNVWPTLGITTRHEVSIEIAVLLLVLTLYTRIVRPIPPRAFTGIAVMLTVLTIARYVEVTAPALFGRPVNLYWDARYLPHVAEMLMEVASPLMLCLFAAGALLALAGVFIMLRLAVAQVAASCSRRIEGMAVASVAGLIIAGYTAGYIGLPPVQSVKYSLPVTRTYWQQAAFIADVVAGEAAEVLPATRPLGDFALPRLAGKDIIVQFVESYGATAYDAPAVAEALVDSRGSLAAAIADTGRRVVSAYIAPPTFGGNSWLSHASFMTGIEVNSLPDYNLLLTQDRPTLATRFGALGYKAVAVMPGLKAEWPEGSFYGFEMIYGDRELDYRGPAFGWWRIPDQYSLARLAERELDRESREPLFVFFTTISSHMPFRPTPPYQPDWPRILTESPFEEAVLGASLSQGPDWTNMRPAYAGTLAYTFTYLGGFLRARADPDLVWIIIGDHQPPANVSGQDVRWDVPVHIVSADDAIIEALVARGFVEGMTPAADPVAAMHELPVTLLSVFSE